MTRSKRIDAVRGLEEKKVEEIARALAQARKNLDYQRQQLQRLNDYTEEYKKAAEKASPEHHSLFLERRAFFQRLHDALEAARNSVVKSSREYDEILARWYQQRGRAKALESAGDRLRAESQKRRDRDEQNLSDEVGARPGRVWTRSQR